MIREDSNHLTKERGAMTNEQTKPEQRAGEPEQGELDFGAMPQQASTQTRTQDAEPKTCNRAGYCYCPKCNPR